MEYLETKTALGDTSFTYELNTIKRDLEEIYIEKGKGVMIRSRAKLLDSNEKCTSYFLNLEKRNANVKYIKTLYNEHGDEINCPNDILKEEEMFYKKLYAATHTEVHPPKNCSFMNIQNTLCNEDKDCCDKDVTLHELGTNLKQLSNNKAPGCDGFTADFYKFFWKDLKHFLFDSLLYSFNTGKLSLDQRRAILCLLPKPNKDLRYLKNWRPLSMLNTDYKILAKTLATRLQYVIGKLISNDQSGYIKGRFIGENIRTVIDVLQYSRDINIKGYITFRDFEKAFDSVSWNFFLLYWNVTILEANLSNGSKFYIQIPYYASQTMGITVNSLALVEVSDKDAPSQLCSFSSWLRPWQTVLDNLNVSMA